MPYSLLILALAAQAAEPRPIDVVARVWAPFISPMGEPFRSKAPGDDTLANWFGQADSDRDGALTAEEMQADAERFFGTLDSDRNGEIGPEEIRVYEWELASEIQVNSQWRRARGEAAPKAGGESTAPVRGDSGWARFGNSAYHPRSLQGAARYGLLNMPQPVTAADTDFNRAITLDEFRRASAERFRLLDAKNGGRLGLAELQALRPERPRSGQRRARKDAPDARIGTPVPLGD